MLNYINIFIIQYKQFENFSGFLGPLEDPLILSHFLAALPEIFLIFSLIFILIFISIKNVSLLNLNNHKEFILSIYNLLIGIFFITLVLIYYNPYASLNSFDGETIFQDLFNNKEWRAFLLFRKTFIIDYYSSFFKIVILILGIFFLYLFKYFVKFTVLVEYPILIGFLVLGLILLVESFDLISMYLSIELVALVSYILAAFSIKNVDSVEAGIKYLILGSTASGFILFGIVLIYGTTSLTDFYLLKLCFYSLKKVGHLNLGILLGCLFLNLGFLFKLSAAPFHMWTPDVYEGSPLPSTILFATIVKVGILAFYLRLVYFLFPALFFIVVQPLLATFASFSLLWGSFGGLLQVNLKRLFAFSAITNIGFILMGLVEGTDSYSTFSVLFYFFLYYLTNIVLFVFLLIIRSKKSGENMLYITDLAGFGLRYPFFALMFSILLFSLAGIPPFAGFWAKLCVLISIWHSKFYYIIFFAVLASIISSFYYLRLVKIMFFDSSLVKKTFIIDFSSKSLFFIVLGIILLLSFSFVTPLFFVNFFNYNFLEFYLYNLYTFINDSNSWTIFIRDYGN